MKVTYTEKRKTIDKIEVKKCIVADMSTVPTKHTRSIIFSQLVQKFIWLKDVAEKGSINA